MNFKNSIDAIKISNALIPGGSTFSKTTYFDQGRTPFSLVKGKGATVTDVDNNEYTDFIMGLGTMNLGYTDERINSAITKQLERGILFNSTHPLEIEVAQKLIDIIPSGEMVRYGKNGSDVLTAALKLARYITGRDVVLSCGYHGWHDWSIAHSSKAGGVPQSVKDTSHKFKFNNIDSLNEKINQFDGDVACVIMDCVARYYPEPNFLEAVRKLTLKKGIILIFDEVVTGFRIHRGGAQAFFGVTPDLSCFGKAIANGYPISALVGKEEYMRKFDDLFFALNFATDAVSLSAANAVLDIYKEIDIPLSLHKKGGRLKKEMQRLLNQYDLANIFDIQGMDPRPILGFKDNLDSNIVKKKDGIIDEFVCIIIEGFSNRNILSNTSFFVCDAHTDDDIAECVAVFDLVCKELCECLNKK